MSTSSTVYTAHDIPDLFNALPMLLGFRPADSLVAVATHGPRRRFDFRLRMDMPPPGEVVESAEVVVGHLVNNGADGAIILAITEQQAVARDLIAAIEDRLGAITPIVIARSDGRRYWVDLPGFPVEGIAYETSEHHLSIVEAVAAGQQVLPDRQALVDRYAAVTGPRRRWLLNAAAIEAARIDALIETTSDPELTIAMREVQPIVDRGLAGEAIDDGQALLLALWVDDPQVQRAVWGQITPANARDVHAMLVTVCRAVVPPVEAGVLGLTSFAAWLTGNGVEALIAAERGVRADPHDPVVQVMLEVITTGVPPSKWVEVEQNLRRAGRDL